MSRGKKLLLGIDFGTGGCKAMLIRPDGRTVQSASAEYPTSHPEPGWAEQNPKDWYDTMVRVLDQLDNKEQIAALAMDSFTHGAVLLDENLNIIRPTIIWTDQRSFAESQHLKEKHFDLIFSTAWQGPAPTWTLPQMLWMKNNEPENYEKIRHILFVKEYVRFLLTGEMLCDRIEAQGTLFWDMEGSEWSEELCSLADIPLDTLPPICECSDVAGRITAKAAKETGLPRDIPVIAGASDSAVEAFASGAVSPGQCILKLATAGNVNVMTAEPHPHPELLTYSHVVPGLWYSVAATNAAAVCQRWFRDKLGGGLDYAGLNDLAGNSPPGSNGLLFHPYLMGERSPYWDSHLRGSFTGISMSSTMKDFSRAVLEGVAFSLRDCYRGIRKNGLKAEDFSIIGGGARSELWSQIVCDVFNAPLRRLSVCDASFGSALLAGVGAGIFDDEISAVQQCLRFKPEVQPDNSNARLYARKFQQYREIHDVLAKIYERIIQPNGDPQR